MEAKKTLIKLDHVKKSYDGKTNVIEDFNLEIKEGEFVTLLGPSGCGKTTILRMLGGFETITDGVITLDGVDISTLPANKRPVNTVFQKYALFPHYNVYDNIAYGLKIKKLPKETIDQKVKEVLEMVDLEGFEKRSISTLSGGQQQRIAIARALVNEPKVLLLDESLSALDYKMRKEMQIEIKEMHKKLGITFIFVTHDQEEALTMSDKVVVMADGIIEQVGTPEMIYNEPATLFVADFIGESNIFNGTIKKKFEAEFAGASFKCVDDYAVNTKIHAVIRPEDVEIVAAGEGQVSGEVTLADFKGTFYTTFVQAGDYEFMIECREYHAPGTTVGLKVVPDNIHLIPYDADMNRYEGSVESISEDNQVTVKFADFQAVVPVEKLGANVSVVDGKLVLAGADDAKAKAAEGTDAETAPELVVVAHFNPDEAEMFDGVEAGDVTGKILFFHYIGDHYSYTISSETEEYYIVDDEDLWNRNDIVSVKLPFDKFIYEVVSKEE